jgi:hypothetical protein
LQTAFARVTNFWIFKLETESFKRLEFSTICDVFSKLVIIVYKRFGYANSQYNFIFGSYNIYTLLLLGYIYFIYFITNKRNTKTNKRIQIDLIKRL